MTHRDWEAHQGLLHRFSNAKHARLTRRGPDLPVLQKFNDHQSIADILIVCCSGIGLVSVFALLALGFL